MQDYHIKGSEIDEVRKFRLGPGWTYRSRGWWRERHIAKKVMKRS